MPEAKVLLKMAAIQALYLVGAFVVVFSIDRMNALEHAGVMAVVLAGVGYVARRFCALSLGQASAGVALAPVAALAFVIAVSMTRQGSAAVLNVCLFVVAAALGDRLGSNTIHAILGTNRFPIDRADLVFGLPVSVGLQALGLVFGWWLTQRHLEKQPAPPVQA